VTFVAFLHFDPYLYWIIIGLFFLIQQYQAGRERELRASQLETQLAEARLQALEAQLHPHFLFNALNTIAVLVRTNRNTQAVRVVTGLGELLRHALDSAGTQFVPLKQEIDFIRRYLEIEQIRFGDRLQVEMEIEPGVTDARVPYLILQPLVENAIRHGIASRVAAGRLRITARRDGDRLRLSVEDDGPGLPPDLDAGQRNGVGLSTTAARLAQLYGDDHRFSLGNLPRGGVAADLTLPFRLSAGEMQRRA
jgi:LytS/YehU family sensor histidine kinase